MITGSNRILPLAALMAVSILCCHDIGAEPAPYDINGMQVRTGEISLYVTNSTGDTIRYFVVEQETAAVIFWAPTCGTINVVTGTQSKEVPYSSIPGYSAKSKIIFSWWRCIESPSGV
ncbi:MAG: hypothetical protein FJ215_13835 [Ignavibacteria bacterium]|nr:hypothetical protein [Ignavibacteria bacterium]